MLRAVIDEIRLVPEGGHLEIELAGNLARIPALMARSRSPSRWTVTGCK